MLRQTCSENTMRGFCEEIWENKNLRVSTQDTQEYDFSENRISCQKISGAYTG